MSEAKTGRRRWFQFSLRTLFVALTVAAVSMGWLFWNIRQVRERERLRQDGRFLLFSESKGFKAPEGGGSAALPIVWRLCGAKPVVMILLPEDVFSEDDQRHYRRMFPEAIVNRQYVDSQFYVVPEQPP